MAKGDKHVGSTDVQSNKEFSKDEMLTSESIANFILQAITTPDNAVVEEIVIRRTAGDMRV